MQFETADLHGTGMLQLFLLVGVLSYFLQELLTAWREGKRREDYSEKTDIYSLAMVFFELFCERSLLFGVEEGRGKEYLARLSLGKRPEVPEPVQRKVRCRSY